MEIKGVRKEGELWFLASEGDLGWGKAEGSAYTRSGRVR